MAPKDVYLKSSERAKKSKHLSGGSRDDDRDFVSQSEATTQLRSPTARSKNPSGNQKKPELQDWEHSDDEYDQPIRQTRYEPTDEQRYQQSESNQMQRPLILNPNLRALSGCGVYEHILRLRTHGISVKLGPEAIPALDQLAAQRQLPISTNHFNPRSIPVDLHHPIQDEIERVEQAFVTVLALGGQLEIPAFSVQAQEQRRGPNYQPNQTYN